MESFTDHIRKLEESLLKPEIRSSKLELEKRLAEDFFEFGSSGKVLYKNEAIPENGIGTVKMKLSNFEMHQLADDVVLATYQIFNEVSNQHSLRSSIWKRNDGAWKMYFHQGTKMES